MVEKSEAYRMSSCIALIKNIIAHALAKWAQSLIHTRSCFTEYQKMQRLFQLSSTLNLGMWGNWRSRKKLAPYVGKMPIAVKKYINKKDGGVRSSARGYGKPQQGTIFLHNVIIISFSIFIINPWISAPTKSDDRLSLSIPSSTQYIIIYQ